MGLLLRRLVFLDRELLIVKMFEHLGEVAHVKPLTAPGTFQVIMRAPTAGGHFLLQWAFARWRRPDLR
jgi:hypothetical protein